MDINRRQPLILWYITDDKPGHINQILGLVDALERQLSKRTDNNQKQQFSGIKAYVFSTRQQRRALFKSHWSKLKGLIGIAPDISLPKPRLIVGAGHSTHWTVIAASNAFKVPSVLLLKPSLPLRFFNYVIVPEHDGLENTDKVFTTKGAINRIQPQQKTPSTGLILLGGPSKHYIWNDEKIVKQLEDLIALKSDIKWHISTSRRTPENFELLVSDIEQRYANVTLMKFADCEKNWLKDNLSKNQQIWVTPDSVSMVFEALSSGADVGVFDLQSTQSKVSGSIMDLIHNHQITTINEYLKNKEMFHNDSPLNEGEKAASWLLEKIGKVNVSE